MVSADHPLRDGKRFKSIIATIHAFTDALCVHFQQNTCSNTNTGRLTHNIKDLGSS